MAKRSRGEITESLALISWLYWQVLRRQSQYASAVSVCKARWTAEVEATVDPIKRFAAERTLAALTSLESYRWTGDGKRDDIAIAMMVDDGMRHAIDLDDFVNAWKIEFPVPPSIPELPRGELLTSPWCVPVKLISGDRARVEMHLFPHVGMEILAAHMRGVLLNFAAKRKGTKLGSAQLISRKPRAKLDLTCTSICGDGMLVSVHLPVHLESLVDAVKAKIKKTLRVDRTETTWRDKAYYEQMFDAVDHYNRDIEDNPAPKRSRSVQAQIDRFNGIAGLFGFASSK